MALDRWPNVAVVVLNYRNWHDTIECLESILRIDYPDYHLIVLDNDSPNDSVKYIRAWLEGNFVGEVKCSGLLEGLCYPPVPKPIPYVFYTKETKGYRGCLELKSTFRVPIPDGVTTKEPVVVIQTGENLGFAGGNNVGIRYAMESNGFGYIWILNNDTVVERDSLRELVKKAELYRSQGERVGIVGSKLLCYDRPDLINGVGGVYNKWFGSISELGKFERDEGQYDNEEVVNRIDYVVGASMLVSVEFVKDVGFLCEDYFLYFEEMDWITRGRRKGWSLGYCWRSRVYHKGGGSIGGYIDVVGKKLKMVDYYWLKNRIAFTKRFFPMYLWSVYLGFLVVMWRRIKRGQFKRLWMVLKVLLGVDCKDYEDIHPL